MDQGKRKYWRWSQATSMHCSIFNRSQYDQYCNASALEVLLNYVFEDYGYRTGFVPSMSFSLDHCLWMHEPNFRVDDWLLYETFSTKASMFIQGFWSETFSDSSRAFIEGRLWTKSGKLVVSSAQEGLIRTLPSKTWLLDPNKNV